MEEKRKRGRPFRTITDEQRRQIRIGASLGLTNDDIALLVGIPRTTLMRRCQAELEAGRSAMRRRLLVIQWKLARRSAAMAIWLGKQFLSQREPPAEIVTQAPVPVDVVTHALAKVNSALGTVLGRPANGHAVVPSAGSADTSVPESSG